jgi:integrase
VRFYKQPCSTENGLLVPWLSLALFGGLRPTELRRVFWNDIDMENKVLFVRGAVAKLRARVAVQLSDNLIAWLAPHFERTPLQPANL